MSDALNYVDMLFGSLLSWFNQVLNAIPKSSGWILAVFAMYSSFRFLIFPIVGGRTIGGSDSAKKSAGKRSSNKSSDRTSNSYNGSNYYGIYYYGE